MCQKKFDVSAAGNVHKLQVVLNGNECAPVCIQRFSKRCDIERDKKNSEQLISLLSQISVAMITSGEVVSTKMCMFFLFFRILWQFIVTIRNFHFFGVVQVWA